MPKIFTEEERAVVKNKLLLLGLKQLETKGFRSCRVEELAIAAGIAKGTFYNFFSSKESFFYEVMLYIRDENRKAMEEALGAPDADRKTVSDFLFSRYSSVKTVYNYFSVEEMNIIFRKIPDKLSESGSQSEEFLYRLLGSIKGTNPRMNRNIVINMLNIMALSSANRGLVLSASRDETLRFMADSIAEYIFKME